MMHILRTLGTLFRPNRRRFTFAAGLALAAVLAAAGCSQLAIKERELTFRIEPGNAGWFAGLPEGLEDMWIDVDKNGHAALHAWWWPQDTTDAPTLLYLHGARWNLTGHLFRIRQLRELGFSVLAIDYRGFGQSGGVLPSEESVYEDARIAWERLAQLQPDARQRFIYGHSLGGAIAVDLAAHLPPGQAGGLIVEASFTTLADVARSMSYAWLPLQLIMTQRFDSASKVGNVRMPVLIVHGTDDRYVLPRFSEALYRAAREPKRLLLIEGGSHNNSLRVGRERYRSALHGMFPAARLIIE